MGYKILGYVVWHGGKWYMKSRLRLLLSRKALAAGTITPAQFDTYVKKEIAKWANVVKVSGAKVN